MADIEVKALTSIAALLDPLDRDQAGRVLAWARQRYIDGPQSETHEIFKAWTDEIVEKAQAINVHPRAFERAVLSLVELVEQQQNASSPADNEGTDDE
jgi:hypothetical protein